MLETVISYGFIFYAMGIVFGIGVISKIVSHTTAGKMVQAASEIQKSNHRFMRLVKAKFEHASMVSDRVQNVEAFVKKYLYEYKVFGVRLETWRSMQRKMVWLVLALGICGFAASYQVQGLHGQAIQYATYTGILAMILFSVHIFSDETAKLEAAKNYIVDYLENVCARRYEKANQEAAQEASLLESSEPEAVQTVEQTIEESEKEIVEQKNEQEVRIRAILEEFLA